MPSDDDESSDESSDDEDDRSDEVPPSPWITERAAGPATTPD